MLDFICELEKFLPRWPAQQSLTLVQLADLTESGVPLVVEVMSGALGRELEVHENITATDANQALDVLKDRMRTQLEARRRRQQERREKSVQAYDITMEKVRVQQMDKNWRNAYRTLSYFLGVNEKDLPDDLIPTLCSDCLRLGIKSGANLQELGQWLRKGVTACLKSESPEAMEDALDFIDAYSDYFAEQGKEPGRRLVNNVLASIKQQATALDLSAPAMSQSGHAAIK